MRSALIVVAVGLAGAGCAAEKPRSAKDCAEASFLYAEAAREHSKLLASTDPALGPIHEISSGEALNATYIWKNVACSK